MYTLRVPFELSDMHAVSATNEFTDIGGGAGPNRAFSTPTAPPKAAHVRQPRDLNNCVRCA
jgi:hypothetical protein